jgi:hypothetical protein
MLPASVEPRAQTKITSLHPPPIREENSFSVRPVRSPMIWRVATTASPDSGMAIGVAEEAMARARMVRSFIVVDVVARKRRVRVRRSDCKVFRIVNEGDGRLHRLKARCVDVKLGMEISL